jgi:hypothetical protein
MTKKKVKAKKSAVKRQPTLKPSKPSAHLQHYIHSFTTFDKPFWMTVIFDFAYCITIFSLTIFILWLFAFLVEPLALALQSISGIFSLVATPDQLTPGLESSLDTQFGILQTFYIQAGIAFFGSIFTLLAVTTIYKSFIWVHLTKQKLTNKYFLQFFKVNVLWQFLWLLLATATFLFLEVTLATYLLLVQLLLYMYFTPFLRSQLTAKHTLKRIYNETFVMGVKNLPQFIVPIVLIIITVTFGLWVAGVIAQMIEPLSLVIFSMVLIFLTMSWVRFYFNIVATHVTTK